MGGPARKPSFLNRSQDQVAVLDLVVPVPEGGPTSTETLNNPDDTLALRLRPISPGYTLSRVHVLDHGETPAPVQAPPMQLQP